MVIVANITCQYFRLATIHCTTINLRHNEFVLYNKRTVQYLREIGMLQSTAFC